MVDGRRDYADRHAQAGLGGSDRWIGAVPHEIALEQARRHLVAFQRIVANQEAVVAKMEDLGDCQGAKMARTFLETCRYSLRLAADHLNRLLEAN
jgi:hypothetical protein